MKDLTIPLDLVGAVRHKMGKRADLSPDPRRRIRIMWEPSETHPLRRMFAGLTEHILFDRFGVADPPLADYLSGLLTRFVHSDTVYSLRNEHGRPMTELVEMIIEAESLPEGGRTKRDYHKHIGDFALFWTGVYPECLSQARRRGSADHFLNYAAQGKRSYGIAGSYDDDKCHDEAMVLQRLANEFELCACGLREVRREWEALPSPPAGATIIRP